MPTLLVATRNRHKVSEIQSILGAACRCLSLDEFPGAPVPVEDGATFAANALIKARSLSDWLCAHPPAAPPTHILADDSGLEVDALGGAPGIHSARFAALDSGAPGNSPDAANNAKLLRLLADVPDAQRAARFHCALAFVEFAAPDAVARVFEGRCEGRIQSVPGGAGGFGYDPLFIPDGHDRSFAELGEDVKNAISHRARALALLRQHLENLP
jgi:XTP/dITP diphosphohydrolase